jgi:hypothetical protein
MALLAEYALTPDVFDATSYTSDEVCCLYLRTIKDVLLQEGLVRSLWDGEWAGIFPSDQRPWHPRGKELIKKLAIQSRLIIHPKVGKNVPTNDFEWCGEALASHKIDPLNGILVTDRIAGLFKNQPIVAPIQNLPITSWWTSRSPSIRLHRTLSDYKAALSLVLRHANSIMFIDPHIDPDRRQYQDFTRLLEEVGGRAPSPLIEIHRVCYRGSGPHRQFLNLQEIEESFRSNLSPALKKTGINIEVFIWDDFHDRYLISNLVGIGMQNGFETTTAPKALTTWTRLGRTDRDDIQREFDPASNRHFLKYRFGVP